MDRQPWGRNARIYVAPVEFDEAGAPVDPADDDFLTLTRSKDVGNTEEANVSKATARDLDYAIAGVGEKELSVETECLLTPDEVDEDDKLLVRNAAESGAELWVLVTRDVRTNDSGPGMLFIGNVFGWPAKLPESGADATTLKFQPSRF